MTYNVLIAAGVLVIIAIIIAERRWQKKRRLQIYNISDTVTNTACGISDRVFNIFFDTFQFVLWSHLYMHVALVRIPVAIWSWVLCLIAVDFVWYWYHRLGHEVRLLWAIHGLHHQSEEYNISVGFRISIFQSIVRGFFWLILPVAGFHPETIITVLVFHGLYQLPQHTRIVPRLGLLEYIFVTPSVHRVHHASNDPYLDKNYGGVLVIWDRIFGTYAREEEAPVYGLTEKTGTLGFLEAHLYGFRKLAISGGHTHTFRERLRYLLGKPSVVPASGIGSKPEIKNYHVPEELSAYVLCQMVSAAVLTVLFIFNRENWENSLKVLMVFLIFWTLASATLNYSNFSRPLVAHEWLRNAVIAAVCILAWISGLSGWQFALPVFIPMIISLFLIPYRKIVT